MRRGIHISLAGFLCGVFVTTLSANAQVLLAPPPDLTLSAGYSYLQTQRAGNLFYDHSGAYVDANFAWPLPLAVPLQAGFGLTGSGYFERESFATPASDNFFPYYRLYSDLGLFEIEPRIGLRLGRDTGFFAVPRVGAGLLIDSYSIDQSYNNGGNPYVYTHDHTGAAVEIRPAIQGGYSWGPVTAGIDASYMYAWGDFGGLGHHAQEGRVGAFLSFRF